jgi:hypothetical protein
MYAALATFQEPSLARKVKLLINSAAASATSVQGWVLSDDGADFIGQFTGQTAETALESGEAVLKVPVTAIQPDGALLGLTDTPLVVAYNATFATVGPGSAT